jgi:protein-tyrosine-phosphatase
MFKVEILRPGAKVPIKEGAEDLSEELTMPRNINKGGMITIDPSSTLPHEEHDAKKSLSIEFESTLIEGVNGSILENLEINEHSHANDSQEIEISISDIVASTVTSDLTHSSDAVIEMTESEQLNAKETYDNETFVKIDKDNYEEILKTDVPEVEKLMNAVLPDDQYIVECKLLLFNIFCLKLLSQLFFY